MMADIELKYECQFCGAKTLVNAPPCVALVAFGYCGGCKRHVDDFRGTPALVAAMEGMPGCEGAREQTLQAIAAGELTAALEVQVLCGSGPVCTAESCDHPDRWCPFGFR